MIYNNFSMEEPSVLDYLKSKLTPWKGPGLKFPLGVPVEQPTEIQETPSPPITLILEEQEPEPPEEIQPELKPEPSPVTRTYRVPWRSLLALFMALLAQYVMSPREHRSWVWGVFFLITSICLLIWATIKSEWKTTPIPEQSSSVDPSTMNPSFLFVGLALSVVTYFSFGGLKFTVFNLSLLFLALLFTMWAFWIPGKHTQITIQSKHKSFNQVIRSNWYLTFNISTVLIFAAVVWVIFFRFYRLAQVPPEMNSDHAEKILDILRVLSGQTNIFFPTNGGREALIFYLDAGLHLLFKLPLDFTTLKLASITVGVLSLPFIYLCGKELGSQRIGMLAFLFAGIAYWPNVVSRFGLRLPFYFLFTALTIYLLLVGIRTSKRNYFTLAGVSLGLSLYGYSADRILPLLIILAVGLYLIHSQSKGRRQFVLVSTVVLVIISLVLFTPLLRYIVAEPNSFLFRTLTRMGDLERPLPGPAWQIFLDNVGRALAMVAWNDGEIWPISIPGVPALSVVSGALFYLGTGLLIIRYVTKRHWLDLFMLLSIPVLMLPSTLSLAFPAENPNLYRTGGALVPIFLIIAIALDGLMDSLSFSVRSPWGKRIAWALALLLLCWSSLQDYDLVFNQFFKQYQRSAWNTSEIGSVARSFTTAYGSPDTVWVMGFPHWVDTRLVAINAGYPERDYEIFVNELDVTKPYSQPKMFFINPNDEEAIASLKQVYPQGWLQLYKSKVETKDFMIYFVPPQQDN
jgi:hypothetical protein